MTTPRKTPSPAKRTTSKATRTAKTPARPARTAADARAQVATRLGFKPVVEATLAATPLGPGDAAAAHLARALAAAIDRPRTVADRDDALHRHGPKLLEVLREIGATPASRNRLLGSPRRDDEHTAAPPPPPPADQTPGLTALRQAHGR